jgi:hypothetical protein
MENNRPRAEGAEGSWVDATRDVKDRAQAVADRAAGYVRDTAERAGDQIAQATGRPLGAWTSDVKRWVNGYPLQSALVALGVGYLVGRAMRGH